MKYQKLGIIEAQVNGNMQAYLHSDSNRVGAVSDCFAYNDSKLAQVFYSFLVGKSNCVPSFEYFKRVADNASSNIISVGCGFIVKRDLEDESKMQFVVDEPIKANLIRRDVIDKDGYLAVIQADRGALSIESDVLEEIDVEKDSKYDKNRITMLQKYLGNYDTKYPTSKTNDSVSKK